MRARRAQARRLSTYFVSVFWRLSRSIVATRWPALSSATATCIAVVDLPEPPFSFPSTITCAELGTATGAWSNIYATLDNAMISISEASRRQEDLTNAVRFIWLQNGRRLTPLLDLPAPHQRNPKNAIDRTPADGGAQARPAPPDNRALARGRRNDRAGADHGRAARRAPFVGAARAPARRARRGVDLRQPGAIRAERGF